MSLTIEQKNDILRHRKLGYTQKKSADLLGIMPDTIRTYLKTGKVVMICSDYHCGHVSGLTPPKWRPYTPAWESFYAQWDEVWQEYKRWCDKISPDILIDVGDALDGKGFRSGGSEQIATTYKTQAEMAADCIMETNAKQIIMVYGTPYHTGQDEDFEDMIVDRLPGCEVKIGGHEFPKINGVQFDIKHKIGSSSIPHGRTTAINKSKLWNLLWNCKKNGQPNAQVILRGHVHYHAYTGGEGWLGMTCPALQGWGSKFGVRQCEGIVDTGIVWAKIYQDSYVENIEWSTEIFNLPCFKVETYSL